MALFGLFKSNNSADNGRRIPVRSIVRYTHMPEILPRIRAIGGKLGHFAFMLALIFRSARLLPANHPMLNANNIGRYGITDVMATAANGLVMKRENMDQILIFGAVVAAFVMIAIQAVLICVYAFFGSAQAADGSMFTTPTPEKDLAFQFLRNVFGVQDIFGKVDVVQTGFHAVMGFYSQAMMIIAVIIVVYYVITVVGEAAQTGTPFGRRFNGLWAPVRLILALGLLVPLGSNLNAAQYLTLNVAKLGSGLATKAWSTYTENFLTGVSKGGSPTPEMKTLGEQIFANESCRAAYNRANPRTSTPVRVVVQRGNRVAPAAFTEADIEGLPAGTKTIKYIWTTQTIARGTVTETTCGSISMQVVASVESPDAGMQAVNTMARDIQRTYITAMGDYIKAISGASPPQMPTSGSAVGKFALRGTATSNPDWAANSLVEASTIADMVGPAIDSMQTTVNQKISQISFDNSSLGNALTEKMKKDAIERGWMSAGIYYSEMSKTTQLIYDAVNKTYPEPLANAKGSRDVEDPGMLSWLGQTFGLSASTKEVRTLLGNLPKVTGIITTTVEPNSIRGDAPKPGEMVSERFDSSYNPLLWIGRKLFGNALIILIDVPSLNPMNALLQAGNSILERSVWLVGALVVAQLGAIGAGIAGMVGAGPAGGVIMTLLAQALSAAGGLIWFFIVIGMAAGVVLFYVLPLMPMMYFFFSAVNWVIEVAEAFISMPLFALSHLRIDGDGLPGQTAYNGWLTLFGVMLRPILIIVGFIVGSLVFNAGAYYLGQIYKHAIFAYRPDTDTTGIIDFDKIGFFGLFMYIILYVYMIYILANSSFKLIDQIPDKAMRWIGGQQPFTGDRPVDIGSMQSMALAGYGIVGQAKGAVSGLSGIGKLNESQQDALKRWWPNRGVSATDKVNPPTGSG